MDSSLHIAIGVFLFIDFSFAGDIGYSADVAPDAEGVWGVTVEKLTLLVSIYCRECGALDLFGQILFRKNWLVGLFFLTLFG